MKFTHVVACIISFLSWLKNITFWGFPSGSVVKNLPVNAGDRVLSFGQEDPLEKEMVTHSNTLAWKIPWMEEPGGLQSMGLQRVGYDLVTSLSLSYMLLDIQNKFRS